MHWSYCSLALNHLYKIHITNQVLRLFVNGCMANMKPSTHWGWVTHICISKLVTIGSDNCLSPDQHQAIIWTNAGILLIGPLRTNFSEIFENVIRKMAAILSRPQYVNQNLFSVQVLVLNIAECQTENEVFAKLKMTCNTVISEHDIKLYFHSKQFFLMIRHSEDIKIYFLNWKYKMFTKYNVSQQWKQCGERNFWVNIIHCLQ